jgi:hypothetical protein
MKKNLLVLALLLVPAGLALAAEGGTANAKPQAAPASAGIEGEYENADQKTVIELLPKGRAFLSFHGLTQECSYAVEGKSLKLTCDGEETRFTIEDDGTLMGPPDSFLTRMKRKKKDS